jgi:hypothetical protein
MNRRDSLVPFLKSRNFVSFWTTMNEVLDNAEGRQSDPLEEIYQKQEPQPKESSMHFN